MDSFQNLKENDISINIERSFGGEKPGGEKELIEVTSNSFKITWNKNKIKYEKQSNVTLFPLFGRVVY